MGAGTLQKIFIAPAAKAAMVKVERAEAVVARGLVGDRYFAGIGAFSRWPGEGRAITLIESESLDAIWEETGIDLSAGRHRRNLVTQDVRLSALVNQTFSIGQALLRGSRLCLPCRYLEKMIAPGLYDAMRSRGGLRAQIIRDGTIAQGDPVIISKPVLDSGEVEEKTRDARGFSAHRAQDGSH